MDGQPYRYPVQVFYEDTDFSGVVYHANYLRYFERAREMVIGPDELVRLWREQGLGFAVYKAEVTYHEGAEFGDILEIRSTYSRESDYRLIWDQSAWRRDASKPVAAAIIHLVCLGPDKKLRPIPPLHFEQVE